MNALLLVLVISSTISCYNIDPKEVSISGISSGAFFSVQYHIAYSSEVKGVGVIAGGPYYCAQGSLSNAFTSCMYGLMLDVQKLISLTKTFEKSSKIDPLDNVKNSRVYLFSGTKDSVVYPNVMLGAETFYKQFTTPSNIEKKFTLSAEHCLPTNSFGNACTYKGSPYINNCNYDTAGEVLKWMYGDLSPKGSYNPKNLVTIDQSKYIPSGYSPSSLSVSSKAYAYVPTSCQDKTNKCKLHVALHGCVQTTADIGDKYYTKGGYNEWSETNNIIILYPQAAKSSFMPQNPNGCWDWWGYTTSDYAFKNAPQMVMVNNMIKGLSE